MRFNFDEDQLMFQSSIRDFLANECTPEQMGDLKAEIRTRIEAIEKRGG